MIEAWIKTDVQSVKTFQYFQVNSHLIKALKIVSTLSFDNLPPKYFNIEIFMLISYLYIELSQMSHVKDPNVSLVWHVCHLIHQRKTHSEINTADRRPIRCDYLLQDLLLSANNTNFNASLKCLNDSQLKIFDVVTFWQFVGLMLN